MNETVVDLQRSMSLEELRALNPIPQVVVTQHPQGGWTHGVLITGAARVYQGHYGSKRAASKALK